MPEDYTSSPPSFLADYIPPRPPAGTTTTPTQPPFLTLTFAQSIDAKIAGPSGEQIALSGTESMLMTHWMRSMHDSILIGVQTAINDDPRLNVRLLPEEHHHKAPTPIILDPTLRLPPTARMLTTLSDPATPHAKSPWVICAPIPDGPEGEERRERARVLIAAGARIFAVALVEGRLPWRPIRPLLAGLGYRSVMVEGGATVIRDLLHQVKRIPVAPMIDSSAGTGGGNEPYVDLVIITVAPMIVGNGLSIDMRSEGSDSLPRFTHASTHVLGRDAVMVFKR